MSFWNGHHLRGDRSQDSFQGHRNVLGLGGGCVPEASGQLRITLHLGSVQVAAGNLRLGKVQLAS